jgi:hypothetical protein
VGFDDKENEYRQSISSTKRRRVMGKNSRNELTPNYTEVLVASMPRRLNNVIDKNGAATKY